MLEDFDRYSTKRPPDDFERPFFKTGAGVFVIAAGVFVLFWFLAAVVFPAIT